MTCIPVVSYVLYKASGNYNPGLSSIFGGILQSVILLKIASPHVYIDWLAVGIIDICLGFVLLLDPALHSMGSLIVFEIFIAASSLTRLWIGVTYPDGDSLIWFGTSGGMGLCLLIWLFGVLVVTDHVQVDLPVAMDIVLRVDLLLRGVAFGGFALSLRNR